MELSAILWRNACMRLLTATLLFLCAACSASAQQTPERLALTNARVYVDAKGPAINDAVVLIERGKVAAVGPRTRVQLPPGTSRLDCAGATIVAGFWNSHIHFTEPRWSGAASTPAAELTAGLQQMLTRYGFTSVVDAASFPQDTNALRARIERGELRGPRILTAGLALYPPNGVPYYVRDIVPPEIVAQLPQPSTAAQARALVARNLEGGADLVKLFTGSWVSRGQVLTMPLEVARAAVQEAHRRGRRVMVHPSNVAGLQVALAAGVDIIGHSVEDTTGWDDALLARMQSAGMALVPTLELFRGDHNFGEIAHESRAYLDRNGRVLFGTDVGFTAHYNPTEEYRLMQRAGLSFSEILAALTTAPAQFWLNKSGRIAVGEDADLVVLEGDPAQDIAQLAKVRYTLRVGRLIYDSTAAAAK